MGLRVDIWSIFGSSKNVKKYIAICPEVKINHFGIIKITQNPKIYIGKTTNLKKTLNCLPYLGYVVHGSWLKGQGSWLEAWPRSSPGAHNGAPWTSQRSCGSQKRGLKGAKIWQTN